MRNSPPMGALAMNWGKKKIGGQIYDLTHLDPFILPVTPKIATAPTFLVRVSFGCHVFTKKWEEPFTPDLRVVYGSEERCFCIDRHSLSLNLPQIIKETALSRVYFSQRDSFVVPRNMPGLNGPYAVFFKIDKARSDDFDARMIVVSAYEKPGIPKRLPAITFATLVSNVVLERPVRRPKK